MTNFITEWPEFLTATCLNWNFLLKKKAYKEIIISSLKYLVNMRKIRVFAFVIMDNHIHLIWQMLAGSARSSVQRDFLKYVAGKIKADLKKNDPNVLEFFYVNAKDRWYQFWERNALNIELRSHAVFMQKLEYIHYNPVRAGICLVPTDYHYSSARFYDTGIDNWGFLTHWNE